MRLHTTCFTALLLSFSLPCASCGGGDSAGPSGATDAGGAAGSSGGAGQGGVAGQAGAGGLGGDAGVPDVSCQSECVVGQARCMGAQTQKCMDHEGCGRWDSPADCPAGLACRTAGMCLAPTDTLLFVSPQGNDAWSGALEEPDASKTDGPLASPSGARDRLRVLRGQGKLVSSAVVLVRDGAYVLEAPLEFAPQDSGSEAAPITFASYPGERPRLRGGRRIAGWEVNGGRWTVDLPEVAKGSWYFSALWVDGVRRTRARSPNQGYFRTAGTVQPTPVKPSYPSLAFRFTPGDLQQYSNLGDAEVEVYHAWSTSIERIASIDLTESIVEFVAEETPYEKFGPSQRYIVGNVPEALDDPGEWYLDRTTGRLTYLPLAGEDPATVEVIAPVLSQWLVFSGTPGDTSQVVSDIHVRGLVFEYADWLVDADGVRDGQAATELDAAIEARNGRRIVLDGLEIAHASNYGVGWRSGSQYCVLRRSELSDLGGGGVRIGEGAETETHHNVVDNCYIHDLGRLLKGAIGVWIGRSSFNEVVHNEITDTFYSGVSVGWSWGYASTTAHDNLVAHNHIHHIGKGVLSDMGGVYTLGVSPGTRVVHNHIHDVMDFAYGGWGLYTDEGSSGIELSDNVVHSTHSTPFHQHYGENNTVTNNILAFGREGQIRRSREHEEDQHSFDITRNIVVSNNGLLLQGVWGNGLFSRDYNLYWDVGGDPPLFNCRTLAEEQAAGIDVHSVVADPQFEDALHFDFRLKPGSPALGLGFVPFDFDDFGLYGEAAWVTKPLQQSFGASYLPDAVPQDWHEGFETTALGQVPEGVIADGTTVEARIEVTEEQAFTGTRSLVMRDAAGLDPTWLPYFYFDRVVARGTVTATFSIRRTSGSPVFVELRDNRNPYVAGPSLVVSSSGALIASGKDLGMNLPADAWVSFTAKANLGLADGLYDLEVQVAGAQAQQFTGLGKASAPMCNLSWLGFVATGSAEGVVYVDDVGITVTP